MPANLRPYAAAPTLVSLAVLVAFAVAGPVAVGGGHAQASQVGCGETITADTTLDSDLVDCPNNGIVIGADDITLDLNGHTVSGNGERVKRCGRRESCDFGLLNDGHDGVTVRNGSVRDFGTGVFVGKARHNRVLARLLVTQRVLRLRDCGIGAKRGPQQLRQAGTPLRRRRDRLVRLAPHPDPRQLVPAQRPRHPRRRFHRQRDQAEPVLTQRRPGSSWRRPTAIRCDATAALETTSASSSAPAAAT